MNLAAPSVAPPCLQVRLNGIVLVGCTKFSSKTTACFGVQNVFYLNVFNHAHTLSIYFCKPAIASVPLVLPKQLHQRCCDPSISWKLKSEHINTFQTELDFLWTYFLS